MTKKNQNSLNEYTRYSSLAVEMVVIILLFVFAGYKIDNYLMWKIPIFTIILSFLGVFIGIYVAIKDFLKKK